METRVYNFSAGPATLPVSVLEEAQRDLVCFPGLGMSVLEISHRSKKSKEILEETTANIRKLLGLPDNYHVLYLQGGASLQFAMTAYNFLPKAASADYVVTGSWGKKAIAEAKKLGQARLAWSGEADSYSRIPNQEELDLDPKAAYVHMTSNETIQGVQFPTTPDTGNVPLICDASSDFLSRPLDVEKYALIYAGAQKNAGPAGVTMVLLRDDLLPRIPGELPTMLNYQTHVDAGSLFNTPPVFAIFMVMLVTRWLLKDIGGLEKMAAINSEKAQLLYDAIDQSQGFYQGVAHSESRS